MKLKFRIAKLEEVEEGLRHLYVQTEGGDYVLQVDGAVGKEKLDEFRNNNIQLQQTLDKYKDLTPEKVAELQELDKKRREKELLDKGEIDAVIQGRVAEMKQNYENTINNLTNNFQTANKQLEVLMIDNAVRDMAIKSGVRETAVDDVLLRAKTTFAIREGKVLAIQQKDGKEEIMYSSDGTNPLSIAEWGKNLKQNAPHLFKDSQGGGAGGSGKGPANNQRATTALGKISSGLSNGEI